MYTLARPVLFALAPEVAHGFTLRALDFWPFAPRIIPCSTPYLLNGLSFKNRFGLAAGLDKDADHLAGLTRLGFGHIEVGTVTPRPQQGNPKPRMFRLPAAQAIINRMGFNNLGVTHLCTQVQAFRQTYQYPSQPSSGRVISAAPIIGINIGKNADTPLEKAADDYVMGLRQVWMVADYVVINISSPNTQGLRSLQDDQALSQLLTALRQTHTELCQQYGYKVPLWVKIAPDMDNTQLTSLADILIAHQIDAVIATNTTLARDAVIGLTHADEAGGLSGAPLRDRATEVVQQLATHLQGALPIIAVGGITTADDALQKVAAGASLVQVYSGLVYKGPQLLTTLSAALAH